MNRTTAQSLLITGEKIIHISFVPGEFVYMDNGTLKDEQGNPLNPVDFWRVRAGTYYAEGWDVYKENINKNTSEYFEATYENIVLDYFNIPAPSKDDYYKTTVIHLTYGQLIELLIFADKENIDKDINNKKADHHE